MHFRSLRGYRPSHRKNRRTPLFHLTANMSFRTIFIQLNSERSMGGPAQWRGRHGPGPQPMSSPPERSVIPAQGQTPRRGKPRRQPRAAVLHGVCAVFAPPRLRSGQASCGSLRRDRVAYALRENKANRWGACCTNKANFREGHPGKRLAASLRARQTKPICGIGAEPPHRPSEQRLASSKLARSVIPPDHCSHGLRDVV